MFSFFKKKFGATPAPRAAGVERPGLTLAV